MLDAGTADSHTLSHVAPTRTFPTISSFESTFNHPKSCTQHTKHRHTCLAKCAFTFLRLLDLDGHLVDHLLLNFFGLWALWPSKAVLAFLLGGCAALLNHWFHLQSQAVTGQPFTRVPRNNGWTTILADVHVTHVLDLSYVH